MKKYLGLAALTTAAALSLTACGGSGCTCCILRPDVHRLGSSKYTRRQRG